MSSKWNSIRDKKPAFEKRVLVFDLESHKEGEPCLKTASLIEVAFNKSGEFNTWQVENEQPSVRDFVFWMNLPELPISDK